MEKLVYVLAVMVRLVFKRGVQLHLFSILLTLRFLSEYLLWLLVLLLLMMRMRSRVIPIPIQGLPYSKCALVYVIMAGCLD